MTTAGHRSAGSSAPWLRRMFRWESILLRRTVDEDTKTHPGEGSSAAMGVFATGSAFGATYYAEGRATTLTLPDGCHPDPHVGFPCTRMTWGSGDGSRRRTKPLKIPAPRLTVPPVQAPSRQHHQRAAEKRFRSSSRGSALLLPWGRRRVGGTNADAA